ncbi:MAG: glycoside hydrolase family 32 protein [Bacteroidota bacterium]
MNTSHPLQYRRLFLYLGLLLILTACRNQSSDSVRDIPATSITPYEADYSQQHRPRFHFSPSKNWMNDPNGLVYLDGEYHLFYQHFPDSTVWGPMHWGHAVSNDLVSWQHLPIALYPDSLGYIFSGSAVVDHNNTSGLGRDGKPPLVALFTHHDPIGERSGSKTFQTQSIAYSNDEGRTWTKYAANPVLQNPGKKDFRDPKVIWDESRAQWVMTLAVYDRAEFYTSPNLIDWTYSGQFGIPGDDRLWECPDLFPIQVQGSEETKWILITSIQKGAPNGGTATSYFIGTFDGNQFIGDVSDQRWLDYGTDDYAFVTWSNLPASLDRRIGIGWMSNWDYAQVVPTNPWRSAMTLPRELKLYKTPTRYEIRTTPAPNLSELILSSQKMQPTRIRNEVILVDQPNRPLVHRIQLTLDRPEEGSVWVRLSNQSDEFLDVGFDQDKNEYYIDRTHAGAGDFYEGFASKHTGEIEIRNLCEMDIWIDHSSVELFADEGRCVMTELFFPSTPFDNVTLMADRDSVFVISNVISELRSIW